MMYKEKSLCAEVHLKLSLQSKHHVEFFNFKHGIT
jgi:hypothetical protein